MIDLHCHILPNIDDGSCSWEMSAEMCRVAADDGIRHIVATPHCNDRFMYDRQRCESMLGELREASGRRIEFSIGCDLHFSYENLADALENPTRYTINRTSYLLIEFSVYGIPPNTNEHIFRLTSRGVVPIITHPERNPLLVRDPQRVLDLIGAGALVQVTANSITGFWGTQAKSVSEWLLKQGAVHVVATDAHDPRHRRPVLSEARFAVAQLVGEDVAEALVHYNPRAIIDGRPLPGI